MHTSLPYILSNARGKTSCRKRECKQCILCLYHSGFYVRKYCLNAIQLFRVSIYRAYHYIFLSLWSCILAPQGHSCERRVTVIRLAKISSPSPSAPFFNSSFHIKTWEDEEGRRGLVRWNFLWMGMSVGSGIEGYKWYFISVVRRDRGTASLFCW